MAKQAVLRATNKAIKAAHWLTDADAGAIEVLRTLARNVDFLAENFGMGVEGKLDNVSIPTYRAYCEQLGLTPLSRMKLEVARAHDAVDADEAQQRDKAKQQTASLHVIQGAAQAARRA